MKNKDTKSRFDIYHNCVPNIILYVSIKCLNTHQDGSVFGSQQLNKESIKQKTGREKPRQKEFVTGIILNTVFLFGFFNVYIYIYFFFLR